MSTNQPSSSMKSVPSKAGELYGPNVLYLESADVNSDGSLVVKNLNNGNKLIIVMFQATWCGHCSNAKKLVQPLADKYANSICFTTVQNDDTMQSGVSASFG